MPIFQGLFDSASVTVISVSDFLLCLGCALCIGLFLAFAHAYRTPTTPSFAMTLALLPAVVCVVILMVNGNIGAGVAVAGAFSLVRFRSAPGTAKEIGSIFLAMSAGLCVGMGYIGYAVLFSLVLGAVGMLYTRLPFGKNGTEQQKTLRIAVPEDLNYSEAFDDLLQQYTDRFTLTQVKTAQMGSIYRLTYQVELRRGADEKELIDRLRCRNGNLEISLCRQETAQNEL